MIQELSLTNKARKVGERSFRAVLPIKTVSPAPLEGSDGGREPELASSAMAPRPAREQVPNCSLHALQRNTHTPTALLRQRRGTPGQRPRTQQQRRSPGLGLATTHERAPSYLRGTAPTRTRAPSHVAPLKPPVGGGLEPHPTAYSVDPVPTPQRHWAISVAPEAQEDVTTSSTFTASPRPRHHSPPPRPHHYSPPPRSQHHRRGPGITAAAPPSVASAAAPKPHAPSPPHPRPRHRLPTPRPPPFVSKVGQLS